MKKYTKDIIKLLKNAGKLVKDQYYDNLGIKEKKPKDLVTKLDIRINEFILKKLKKLTPDFSIYSEESNDIKGNNFSWIIDPIDGTANLILGITFFQFQLH